MRHWNPLNEAQNPSSRMDVLYFSDFLFSKAQKGGCEYHKIIENVFTQKKGQTGKNIVIPEEILKSKGYQKE